MRNKTKLKTYNPTMARLWDVLLSMSAAQQATMLKQADELVKGDRRNFIRKSCHLPVDFATTNRTHKGYIKNISQLGIFIKAQAPIMIGEEVLMIFKVSRGSAAVKLKGEIAHATRWGIGVEFTAKGPKFDKKITDLIQKIN